MSKRNGCVNVEGGRGLGVGCSAISDMELTCLFLYRVLHGHRCVHHRRHPWPPPLPVLLSPPTTRLGNSAAECGQDTADSAHRCPGNRKSIRLSS